MQKRHWSLILLLFTTFGCEPSPSKRDEVLGAINGERVHESVVMVGDFKRRMDALRAEELALKKEAFMTYAEGRVAEMEAKRLGTTREELFESFNLLKEVKITDQEVELYLNKKPGGGLSQSEHEEIMAARLILAKRKYTKELLDRATLQVFVGQPD